MEVLEGPSSGFGCGGLVLGVEEEELSWEQLLEEEEELQAWELELEMEVLQPSEQAHLRLCRLGKGRP